LALGFAPSLTVRIADETRLLSLSWPGAAGVGDFSKGVVSAFLVSEHRKILIR
jgi:hypothetical protein